ncbi:hypothetical protein EUTSA_v10006517mg [Eutrema salsugineum]|uniref:Uncharacterized protein n=1 Tax=Eutrema salsugineum TaxID=72664 RepID=V4LJ06_EUTSA|nr:hypothetical protein EUTSA_v10006517mg [Eutrema salsugineum]
MTKQIDKALNKSQKGLNENYVVDYISFYGLKSPFSNDNMPRFMKFCYAPERYCVCKQCNELARSGLGKMNIDMKLHLAKPEAADLMITRDIYGKARHNLIRKPRPFPSVFLLITGDPEFKKSMIYLNGDIRIMLAQPETSTIASEGFSAAWRVPDLLSGKGPYYEE